MAVRVVSRGQQYPEALVDIAPEVAPGELFAALSARLRELDAAIACGDPRAPRARLPARGQRPRELGRTPQPMGGGASAMTVLRRAITAFLLVKVSILLVNVVWFPVLGRRPSRGVPEPAGRPAPFCVSPRAGA